MSGTRKVLSVNALRRQASFASYGVSAVALSFRNQAR
jgi:hypothetical protein